MYLNDIQIVVPLKKDNEQWVSISFEEAFDILKDKWAHFLPEELVFFAGGEATTEELYLWQRLAREGLKTNNIASFEYLMRGDCHCADKNDIVPFSELPGASALFCVGFDRETTLPTLQPILEFIDICRDIPTCFFDNHADYRVMDYEAFFKALNIRLVKKELTRGIFVNGVGKGYEKYKQAMLSTDIAPLLALNQWTIDQLDAFIDLLLAQPSPVIIYRESAVTKAVVSEMNNLVLLIGIQAQPSSGLLGIKEHFNSQSLFDMGIFPTLLPGNEANDVSHLHGVRNLEELQTQWMNGALKCALILKENPLQEEPCRNLWQQHPFDFVCAITSTMTETATHADLIIPASPSEALGGTFTDSTRQAHQIEKRINREGQFNTIELLSLLSEAYGLTPLNTVESVFLAYIDHFKGGCRSEMRHWFAVVEGARGARGARGAAAF
ncbi:MAG: molybdopterin-dependent oxidoreductase [Bacteroidales bacterium]|jgi:predicted molibdopterin-dependent oxidoreductase YjgC|nr:molybdopterin-dependent oxidoreductase [Bacteroidales bacterium]